MVVHRLNIRGIEVLFPFKPYQCQLNYMDKVIQCLNESLEDRETNGREHCRRNALLESPTGTGKTMCLLCASYAWLLHYQQKYAGVCSFPKIIFASRTHSQLAQAIRELKQSPYSPDICILGSREQMCIHSHVGKMSGMQQNRECMSRVTTHTCEYYENYQSMKKNDAFNSHLMFQKNTSGNGGESGDEQCGGSASSATNHVPDIEDLILEGTKKQFCPFYYSREVMQAKAEIVFMPYNYLIDPRVRKQVGIDISDSILIFDEAHNLEKWCSDAAGFDFPTLCISQSVAELQRILRCMSENGSLLTFPSSAMNGGDKMNPQTMQNDFEKLKDDLLDLDLFIDDIKLNNITKSGEYLFDVLSEINLKPSTYVEFRSKMRAAIDYLENNEQGKKLYLRPTGLRNLSDVLAKIFDCGLTEEEFKLYFKIHIEVKFDSRKSMAQDSLDALNSELEARQRPPKNLRQCKTLSLWCFNPALSMQSIKTHKPQCFILTSGTLSPMDSFAQELGLPFPIRLENPHVIKQDQITIMTASVGPTNIRLNGSFTQQNNEYCLEIGRMLVNMARIVPDGLLVFFPSSSMLHRCTELWRKPIEDAPCLYDSISKYKKIFIEPSDGSQLQTIMTGYTSTINESEGTAGAMFLAVCRGRVSEGLDFSARNGRCVVIVGMPFPPLKDPKVVLKRQYLDLAAEQRKQEQAEKGLNVAGKVYNGNEWYQQESSRAVNQAVGRVIRNKFDYGVVILCDERYSARQSREQLSRWLQKHVMVTRNFGEVVQNTSQFFKKSINEFGISSEKLKAKFIEQMKREQEEQEKINALLPPPTTSRINSTSLTSKINVNSSYQSQEEELVGVVIHEREPRVSASISSSVPVQQYHYNSSGGKQLSRSSPLLVSHQVGNSTPEEHATPVLLNSAPVSTLDRSNEVQLNKQTNSPPPFSMVRPSATSSSPASSHAPKHTPSTSAKPSTKKKSSASVFLEQVKNKLTGQEYNDFKQTLRNLQVMLTSKTSNPSNFANIVNKIIHLFSGDKKDLLGGFREFIPANARSTYDDLIKSTNQVREASRTAPTTPIKHAPVSQKRIREEYDLLSGKRIKKSHPIIEKGKQPMTNNCEPITIDDDDEVVNLTLESRTTSPPVTSPASSSSNQIINPTTSHAQEHTSHEPESGIKCRVCLEIKNNLANSSKCGHVLCMDCWDQCLQVKLECPICRARVRTKHLTKIFI